MEQVVSCNVSATKQLQVCIGDGKASYAYGPKTAPELAMTQSLGQVQGVAWPGVGSTIWEEITFKNNDVSYVVYIASSRNDLNEPPRGGVTVKANGKTLAGLECRRGTAQISLFSINDGFRAAGFCWNRDAQKYTRTCA